MTASASATGKNTQSVQIDYKYTLVSCMALQVLTSETCLLRPPLVLKVLVQ